MTGFSISIKYKMYQRVVDDHFEGSFQGEEHGEAKVEIQQNVGIVIWLAIVLHHRV